MIIRWISELVVGDTVYVREPWLDRMHQGGVLWKTRVKEKHERSGRVKVHEIDGVFHGETGRSGPYAHLEEPTIELLKEYVRQQETELDNQIAWELTHPLEEH